MDNQKAVERVQKLKSSAVDGSVTELFSEDAEALDTLLADCDRYADALVRLAAGEPCGFPDGLRILECVVCHRKTPLNYHDIVHASDCPVSIGQEIIEERKKHGSQDGD